MIITTLSIITSYLIYKYIQLIKEAKQQYSLIINKIDNLQEKM